jgi:hypothetical protein
LNDEEIRRLVSQVEADFSNNPDRPSPTEPRLIVGG